VGEERLAQGDLAHGHRLAQQQAHLLLRTRERTRQQARVRTHARACRKGCARALRSFVVSQPSVPCWPSESETQLRISAASTACSRCCDSNARFDLPSTRAVTQCAIGWFERRDALEHKDELGVLEDGDAAQR